MADLTTTATAGAIMGLGLGVTLPVDGGMLFGALLGAWLATGTKQDLKAWSRLLSLILPTCVGYLFADVALARVPWLTNLAFSAFVCALVVIPSASRRSPGSTRSTSTTSGAASEEVADMLITAVPLIAALAYIAAALRLVCYQRCGARFRRSVSLLASLLGASMAICGLEILLYRPPVSIWHAIVAALLCLLIFRSRGNVAALLRPSA